MESVRCVTTMSGGIGQRFDDLQLLDDRPGPPVRDDERQRVLVLRANVNEVNVEPIDLCDELRQSVQLRLDLAPVIIRRPVLRECLARRERHALRLICDGLLVGPPCGRDALAQRLEFGLRELERERPDRDFGCDRHVGSLLC